MTKEKNELNEKYNELLKRFEIKEKTSKVNKALLAKDKKIIIKFDNLHRINNINVLNKNLTLNNLSKKSFEKHNTLNSFNTLNKSNTINNKLNKGNKIIKKGIFVNRINNRNQKNIKVKNQSISKFKNIIQKQNKGNNIHIVENK